MLYHTISHTELHTNTHRITHMITDQKIKGLKTKDKRYSVLVGSGLSIDDIQQVILYLKRYDAL